MKKYLEVICSILITLIIVSCDKENIELIGESAELEIYEKITDYCDSCSSYLISSDNGIVFFDYLPPFGNYLIHKVDQNGMLLWSKMIEDFGYTYAYVTDVVENSNSSILVLGNYSSHDISERSFVAKLNNNGSIEWIKNYSAIEMERAESICRTKDGGYAICGIKGNTVNGIFIKKIDSSGQLEWNNYYSVYTFRNKIVQVDNGDYLLAGQVFKNDGIGGSSIFKVDRSGEITEIERILQEVEELGIQDVIKGNDEGCLFLFDNPLRLIKLDDQYNIMWERNYSESFNFNTSNSGDYYKFGISKLLNSGYIINGVKHKENYLYENCFLKIDNSGLIIGEN